MVMILIFLWRSLKLDAWVWWHKTCLSIVQDRKGLLGNSPRLCDWKQTAVHIETGHMETADDGLATRLVGCCQLLHAGSYEGFSFLDKKLEGATSIKKFCTGENISLKWAIWKIRNVLWSNVLTDWSIFFKFIFLSLVLGPHVVLQVVWGSGRK